MRAVHGWLFDFAPESYILPNEYTKFVHAYSEQESQGMWICKPTDSSRGRGIFLVKDLSDLTYAQQYVIQKYIERPLLVGGYKLDMRIYVLVNSFNPLQA